MDLFANLHFKGSHVWWLEAKSVLIRKKKEKKETCREKRSCDLHIYITAARAASRILRESASTAPEILLSELKI